jgi:hypothetical protein
MRSKKRNSLRREQGSTEQGARRTEVRDQRAENRGREAGSRE